MYEGRRSARPYPTYIRLPHRPHQTTPASKAAPPIPPAPPLPPPPAPAPARQQGGPVADRTGGLRPRAVGRQASLIRLEPLPGDVRREAISQEYQAILRRQSTPPAAPRVPGSL